MKPATDHFHANPPHRRARYYLVLAGAVLVVGAAYVFATLALSAL